VEPPSWLPQGAAPQAADPEADEAPASDDASAPQDDSASVDGAAEESANGNGHDGSYAYSHDSYSYTHESPYVVRGPFEEGAKPPFHELPGAGFDQSPAPPPPGDELAATGFVTSAASVGLADTDHGNSGADAGRTDGEYGGSGFGGSGAGQADGGFTGGAGGIGRPDSGLADGGLADGESDAAPAYVPEFPPASAPTVVAGPETAGQDTQRMGGAPYTYAPPPPPPPPPPARGRKSATQARRANLIVARLEPWSVMKFSFLISLVAWIVLFVAVALLYYALSSLGVFASLQKTLASVTSSQGSAGVDLSKWTSGTRILGYTMLIGAIDVVLITALSTLGAVVYNLITHLGGGIEITLKETE
jgi:Transmembrane domain of unknown function (DUF3566)